MVSGVEPCLPHHLQLYHYPKFFWRLFFYTFFLTILAYLRILPNMQRTTMNNADTKAIYELRAQVVKALAHPTRLFIVDELAKGEQCVCDLTAMIGADTSTVSKHLSVLKQAGIVKDEKRGTTVFYQLRVPCILNFFGCIEVVIQSTTQERMRLLTP